MIIFLGSPFAIPIIGVLAVITSNYIFDLLLDQSSMETTYPHNTPTIMALLLFLIFLTPKMIMSGVVSHSSYIITEITRVSSNSDTALLTYYIQSLNHHSTIQYFYYLFISILTTALLALILQGLFLVKVFRTS